MSSVLRLVIKAGVFGVVTGGLFQLLPVHDKPMQQPTVSQKLQEQGAPVQQPIVSPEIQQRVESVWVRYMSMLFENPAILVTFPSLITGEIIVETDRPASVPRAIEGVPVKVVRPKVLPPPSGVILLHLDGEIERREDLSACPPGFIEYRRYRWRFCQLPDDFQPIPMDILTLPIGSIPFTGARKISARHYERLMKLPGVTSVVLWAEGLMVRTSRPELVPSAIERLPVKTAPADEPGYSTSTEPSPPELARAHNPEDQLVKPPPAPALPSWQERQAVLSAHKTAWLQLPGVLDVVNGPDAIVAITDHPELFPTEIDGIVVRTAPVDEPVAGVPYLKAKQILERHRQTLKSLPGAVEVGMHRGGIVVYTDNLSVVPSEVEGIPIVAWSTKGPAVAGVSYLQVVAILERNWEQLMRIRGVQEVGHSHEGGIRVNTDYPELLPATVEGVPVRAIPCMGIVIGAVPCPEVSKIYLRHKEAFLRLPGARGVALFNDGIYVATEYPELLPPEVEGIPVRPLPSEEERTRQERENARQQACAQAQLSPHKVSAERIQAVFACHHEALHNNPDVFGLIPSDESFIIITDQPEVMPEEIDGIPVTIQASPRRLPAPPGIILLKHDGTRVNFPQATGCPQGYTEDRQFRWRFCYDPTVPQRIPWEMTMPPVAGIPYATARAITERNAGWLKKVPGVTFLRLGEEGLTVHTQRPELIPSAIEGLPVITTPPQPIAVAL